MSFEYSLEFTGRAPIAEIVTRLASRGLIAKDVRTDGAVLAYPSTPHDQLLRWGGDVELSTTPTGLFVRMNAAQHKRLLLDIIDELAAHNLAVRVDEP